MVAKEREISNIDEVSVNYINAQLTMQLATSRNNVPWNCTVYFVVYQRNFYWLSFPERRHSMNLTDNPYAAIALVVQSRQPVIGLQAEGAVDIIEDINEAEAVLDLYIRKYNQGNQFIELLKAGKNKHVLYCLSPKRVMLFDESSDTSVDSPRDIR